MGLIGEAFWDTPRLILGQHKAMPTSKFLKKMGVEISPFALKVFIILFVFTFFFLGLDFFWLSSKYHRWTDLDDRHYWTRMVLGRSGWFWMDTDRPGILCFPLWQSYFIKLFNADLQCEVIRTFLFCFKNRGTPLY